MMAGRSSEVTAAVAAGITAGHPFDEGSAANSAVSKRGHLTLCTPPLRGQQPRAFHVKHVEHDRLWARTLCASASGGGPGL